MEKFEGLELNGKNVMDIYNQCKKTEKSKETIRAYMFDSISTQIFTPPIDFDKEKIIAEYSSGKRVIDIAKEYNVPIETIYYILKISNIN